MKEDVAMKEIIRVSPQDNVATLLVNLSARSSVFLPDGSCVTAREDIPYGHKIALSCIPSGDVIIKYGQHIAVATADIPAGSWVHTHNCRSARGGNDDVL